TSENTLFFTLLFSLLHTKSFNKRQRLNNSIKSAGFSTKTMLGSSKNLTLFSKKRCLVLVKTLFGFHEKEKSSSLKPFSVFTKSFFTHREE
ncbi:MAG: hypothetical protein ACRDCS_06245, partial [Tannerellaceae bacterium]